MLLLMNFLTVICRFLRENASIIVHVRFYSSLILTELHRAYPCTFRFSLSSIFLVQVIAGGILCCSEYQVILVDLTCVM